MTRKSPFLLTCIIATLLLIAMPEPAWAPKPPWAGDDWNPAHPPAAPEPVALTLIGMGASGAVGYYLGKRKKK